MALKNPFPGMNPYLERHWGDVHTRFMVYACDQISEQLPGDLQARVEETLCVDSDIDQGRLVYPDIRVVEDQGASPFDAQSVAGVLVAEPAVVTITDPVTERHIEIVNVRDGNRVITAIELLSITNKIGKGRRNYLRKQAEYIEGGVNLVELDLIRGGDFSLAIPEDQWPRKVPTTYKICIRKYWAPDNAFTFGVGLRETLPNIEVPLRPNDTQTILRLQNLIDECFVRGRYSSLDYSQPLDPGLSVDDEVWVSNLLKDA